ARWRSCSSTRATRRACIRSGTPFPPIGRLPLALTKPDLQAKNAKFVANRHHRYPRIYLYLHLDYLLGRLCQVGYVGESHLVGNLLLHRHARARIGLRAADLGIDFDAGDAKQALHAVAELGVKRLAEDGVRGGLRQIRLRLLI